MGTRHFIGAVVDGEMRIAQYGQWDGYLSQQGQTCLNFISSFLDRAGQEIFKNQLRRCQFLSDTETDELNDHLATYHKGKELAEVFPLLTRDAGAKILGLVMASQEPVIRLRDARSFPTDSLFCEYAYVLDMDTETLEVYRGFNQDPIGEDNRFHPSRWPQQETDKNGKYQQVRLAFKMPFSEAANGFTKAQLILAGDEEEEEVA